MTLQALSQADYDGFRDFLEGACGIVLGDNKHYLINSRLTPLLTEYSVSSLGELLAKLRVDNRSGLRERVIDAMTTNETSWFRDGGIFDLFKKSILPELAKGRSQPINIWSAACSSGQEPYSISMAVQEYLSAFPGSLAGGVQILATDISPTMLKQAEAGRYDNAALMRGLSAERKQRFFQAHHVNWEIRSEIRQRVRFHETNLLNSYLPLGKFDMIFCRNVLIYFSSDLKRDIITRAVAQLNPGGYLCVGSAESISSFTDAFDMLKFPEGIVYRLKRYAR